MATVVNLNSDELENGLYDQYNDDDIDEPRYSGDDDESIGSIIDAGMRTVGNIVGGGVNAARNVAGTLLGGVGQVLGVTPSPASTAAIPSSSNLSGSLQTSNGRQIPFKLPSSIAVKTDVDVLRTAISKINGEIKTVADASNNNAAALTKLSKEVKELDAKHTIATKTQNKYISRLGASVDKVTKGLQEVRSQAQMQMMMSMLMQPKLESITLASNPDPANPANQLPVLGGQVVNIDSIKSKDDNSMMLMMAMGGFGGDSNGGGGGDFGSNPMMMYALLQGLGK